MILQRSGQEHSRQKKGLHQGPAADYGQEGGGTQCSTSGMEGDRSKKSKEEDQTEPRC